MPKTPSTSSGSSQPDTQSDSDAKGTDFQATTTPGDTKNALNSGDGGVWAAGASTRHYEPIPEYEGLHRWDPKAEWTEKEEKKLVRRVRATLAPQQ